MIDNRSQHREISSQQLAADVNRLAEEVRLLSINLAITVAKTQNQEQALKSLGPQFTELIKKAHDTSRQVMDVLHAFQCEKNLISGLPSSSRDIEQRGGYDRIEATLNHVCELSRQISIVVAAMRRKQKAGES